MRLNAQNGNLALLVFSGLVIAAVRIAAQEAAWDAGNLSETGRFESNGTGELPDGWTIVAPNKALAPHFTLLRDSTGGTRLSASGNGRDECFGFIKYPV